MHTPFLIPLAAFAGVVLIVAISVMAKVNDKETEVAHALRSEEMEHQRKMLQLQQQLDRVKQG